MILHNSILTLIHIFLMHKPAVSATNKNCFANTCHHTVFKISFATWRQQKHTVDTVLSKPFSKHLF